MDSKNNILIVEDHALTLFALKTSLNSQEFIDKIFEASSAQDGYKILDENDGIIAAVFMMEIYYRKNIDKKNMKKVLKNELYNDIKFIKKMYFIENYLKGKEIY